MRLPFVFALVVLFLTGCIDPLPVNVSASEPVLVVDGLITDQPGPYTVKLSLTSEFSANQDFPEVVTGASVWIVDDQGSSFTMAESRPGHYTSDKTELQGVSGRTYQLRIITTEGSEYESSPETIYPAGEIESIHFSVEENAINQVDPTLPQNVVKFSLNATSGSHSGEGFLRWRSTGIYEIMTSPELRTKKRDEKVVPDPVPCSGYINEDDVLVQVDTCACCNCWVTEYSRNAVVSMNTFAGNARFQGVDVARITADSWRFFRKYRLEVEQLSISEAVHEFWEGISAQHKGTGSLFQPNAVKVRGNIRCISDTEKKVFGIFGASSITRKSIFVTRGQLPDLIAAPPLVTADCRVIVENSSNIEPPFW